MFGASGTSLLEQGNWEFGFGFRYQKSFRHFVGTDEQPTRDTDATEVINHLYLFDFSMTYAIDNRNTVSLAIPYVISTRSQTVGSLAPEDATPGDRVRQETSARGFGDFTVTGRRWMLDPETHAEGNFALGLGLKIPTGVPNEQDTFRFENEETGEPDQEVRTVDQSIQPGDGGWGFVTEIYAYRRFGRFAPYLSGSYLFNPEGTSGVRTYRSDPLDAVMSIADQYVGRAGVQWAAPWVDGMGIGLGARVEGVPPHDAFGGSSGFRRPGYAVSIEPSVSYGKGPNTFTVSVPWAIQRDREQSTSDLTDGDQGDAAFADWVLLIGWTHRI